MALNTDDSTGKATKNYTFDNSLFFPAIKNGDYKTLKTVLDTTEVDVNALLPSGRTPLFEAVYRQNYSVVELLLENGADPRIPSCECSQGWTTGEANDLNKKQIYPLEQSLKGMVNVDMTLLLLRKGADPKDFNLLYRDVIKLLIVKVDEPDSLLEYIHHRFELDSPSPNDLSELLVTAVTYGKIEVARYLLKNGIDANQKHPGKQIPLLVLAANDGNDEMCKELIKAGAMLNELSHIDDSLPIASAVEAGLIQAVETLIKIGAEVNVSHHHHVRKTSLLHIAVSKRFYSITNILLGAGAMIRAWGFEKNSPLHIVASDTSYPTEYITLLLSHIKDGDSILDYGDYKYRTALTIACKNRNIEFVKCMIKKGANVDLPDGNHESPLQHAILSGSDQLVDLLISAGADVNLGKPNGESPLMLAVSVGDYTITEMLLEAGADVSVVKKTTDESLLHIAIAAQSEEILALLIDTGKIDVNTKAEPGNTPLMLAARSGSTKLCQILTQKNANLDMKDGNQQETALSLAVYFGKEENACWLIKEGANMNVQDHSGLKTIYWAFFNCRVKALTHLVHFGANLTLHELRHKYPCNLSIFKNEAFVEWIERIVGNPRQLQDLSRITIRRQLKIKSQGTHLCPLIKGLPLPAKVISYLMYDTDEIPDLTQT